MSPIPRLRAYEGPALLSYGFRPFFLLAALYGAAAILVWLPMFYGEIAAPTLFAPRDWHVHEMLYGYAAAVITGFLLTAIPNWTGRLPIQGSPLLVLVGIWLGGRAAIALSASIGWIAATAIDGAFLVVVTAAAAREVAAGRNWRNLKVVAIVGILAAANVGFHLEAHISGDADYSLRAGLGAIVILVTLVGGRIVPSFTHNWLVRTRPGRLPAPLGRFDIATIIVSVAAMVLWIARPGGAPTAIALLSAGGLQAIRLGRWAGDRTLREPLVLILHVGYAFVSGGFLLAAAAAVGMVAGTAGVHAWAVGAIGTMTIAVMTRASLGHTGQALTASAMTRVIYLTVVVAAIARISAVLAPQWSLPLLHVAALAWAATFLGFAVGYGPILSRARKR